MTRSFLSVFLTVCVAVFLTPSYAQAKCAIQRIKGEEKVISPNKLNQALLDATIRAQVNYYRCKHGRSKLAAAGGLRRQASKHSKWMAKTGKLSHRATSGSSRTLTRRLKSSGLRFKTGAENIGVMRLYNIDGRHFMIRSASKCQFTTRSGQPLGRHSYRSLAQLAVKEWMESPGHRKNIMLRKATHMGSGGGIQPKSRHCGAVFLTQIFLG
ncbi:Cysteine-rich secretory protein family protein [Aliiroseovarius halocynthiae]|nr:CAP domain-containing protein [Aliiroseovarius halocynthiae]SMR83590.1 Cysteine-rich secretory protein family protein [Aliiroseovarius halocynthiae]